MESIWREHLTDIGWSERAASQIKFCKASTTLRQYNAVVNKFRRFCEDRQLVFPPDSKDSGVFADFMCSVSDQSTRPLSLLKTASAAVGFLYECMNQPNPMHAAELRHLMVALVKSGTTEPAKRTKVMPLQPFTVLFQGWNSDETISIKDLRLKAVTLMTISFMARPSDLAPHAEQYDSTTGEVSACHLTRNRINFHSDGSVTIFMFGIKNDTNRSGFEVRIPASINDKVDVVQTLKTYIHRTEKDVDSQGPVFISLKAPFRGLTSDGIRRILAEAIELAGLGGQGFTPRCFRPSGANAALEAGCSPEEVMQVGRWKTREVFFDHYVYPKAPAKFTSGMTEFTGLHY